MKYDDIYAARTAIEGALYWLRHEDGWTWDDLRSLCDDAIDMLVEDEGEES